MSNDNRVDSGIPTGGQFAENNRDEASVSLAMQIPTPAYDAFAAASKTVWAATQRRQNLAYAAIREAALAEFPDAVTAVFGWSDDWESPGLRFNHLLDSDGNEIDDSEEIQDLNDCAAAFDDFDTVRKASSFDRDESDDDIFTLSLIEPARPTSGYRIHAEFLELEAEYDALALRADALRFEATKSVILRRYPTADCAIIDNGDLELENFPFTAHQVLDADGAVLWQLRPYNDITVSDEERVFEKELNGHVRKLPVDLTKMSRVTVSAGRGRAREHKYTLPLN